MAKQSGGMRSMLFNGRLLRSAARYAFPDNVTDQARAVAGNFFLQLHPVKVRRRSLAWNYTFGLGHISLFMFGLLMLSGLLLMFYYVPSVERAYDSMLGLKGEVIFGVLLRNIHRWAAHGLVLFVFLHMLRVFYTGAYKKPRELNWIIGVVLLLVTLLMSFTGYLLPWDQRAYWGVQVGSEIIRQGPILGEHAQRIVFGGSDLGQASLIRFYAFHVVLLPLVAVVLIGVHLWRVRVDGGLAAPLEASDQPVGEDRI